MIGNNFYKLSRYLVCIFGYIILSSMRWHSANSNSYDMKDTHLDGGWKGWIPFFLTYPLFS